MNYIYFLYTVLITILGSFLMFVGGFGVFVLTLIFPKFTYPILKFFAKIFVAINAMFLSLFFIFYLFVGLLGIWLTKIINKIKFQNMLGIQRFINHLLTFLGTFLAWKEESYDCL